MPCITLTTEDIAMNKIYALVLMELTKGRGGTTSKEIFKCVYKTCQVVRGAMKKHKVK